MTKPVVVIVVAAFVAATGCKKSGSKSQPPPPPPATIDAAPAVGTAAAHETCSPTNACVAGLTCTAYQPFDTQTINMTCEIPCEPKGPASCPAPQACMVLGDDS